ncbi:NADP-dependent oxidoreductase [Saccharomonospora saliphila]|uniref:NADP-dependent oxidoreductase n=1 Tax=Saccharomonospora saliphila TaxID=369829 RepID=UPI000365F1A7|nr:NADP-dependent oxidoreductase [Saccharomonospora saliphila]
MATAIAFSAYGGPDVLKLTDVEVPEPGPGQVRVRVRAAGVNPIDCKLRGGAFADSDDTFPQRLGNEFAGTIERVGPDVTRFSAGDDVLGFTVMEAYAEAVVVGVEQITAKPAALPWPVAGALSAVGQTAYNALTELRVAEGETLLVHAAAGGVGTVATQLARRLGASVVGTASERNHEYLTSLGAVPVTYGAGLVDRVRAAAPQGVDAALDAIGGDAIDASLALVADRDRIGTLVDAEAAAREGFRRLRGQRSAELLAELAALAADGALQLPVSNTYPLAEAARAHREVETGHVRGKVVLTLD